MTEENTPVAKDGEVLSDYDKALALVERREAATKAESDVLDRKEKLAANVMLGGDSGGRVEPVAVPKDTNLEYTDKFMKGEVNPLEADGISIN